MRVATFLRSVGWVLSVASAFVRRSVLVYLSYKAKVSLGFASLLVSAATFSIVGRVVAAAGPGFSQRYGTDYASFAVVGIVVQAMSSAGLRTFRASIRREQLQGTLELLLTTRVPVPLIVVCSGVGEFLLSAAGAAAFLGAAVALLDLRPAVSPTAVGAVILYGAFMSGIGLASAGVVLVSKEGDPVSWMVGAATALLGGVYFPVDFLPAPLAGAVRFLPTTHALAIVRSQVLGAGAVPFASLPFLAGAAAGSVAVGLSVLRWGYRLARRLGTLGQY